jgi:hypothetical protein
MASAVAKYDSFSSFPAREAARIRRQVARDSVSGALLLAVWIALWAIAWAAVAGPLQPSEMARAQAVSSAVSGG